MIDLFRLSLFIPWAKLPINSTNIEEFERIQKKIDANCHQNTEAKLTQNHPKTSAEAHAGTVCTAWKITKEIMWQIAKCQIPCWRMELP